MQRCWSTQWTDESAPMNTTRFDQSLPLLVDTVVTRFGNDMLAAGAVVRDAGGRLSVILPVSDAEIAEDVKSQLYGKLGAYARPDGVIRSQDDPLARRLIDEAQATGLALSVEGASLRLLDRRAAGADWLRRPAKSEPGIPRVVFASLKGGVGRSTALCVMAAHLSTRGRRVLAVDFDLEAPGIGSMLLNESTLPTFGTLDYFVENGVSGVDEGFLTDMIADSILGSEGARVAVAPAIGKSTLDNPQNMLGKLARAYLEDVNPDGGVLDLSDQLNEMVTRLEKTGQFDVILIDSRAGLHETTASAILALGGDVLLFGLDQPQTYLGYRLMMANLAVLPFDPADDWRDRLRFVHAKASESPAKRAAAEQRFLALYEDLIPPRMEGTSAAETLSADDFDLVWTDPADDMVEPFGPAPVLHFSDDARYRDFDPVSDRAQLTSASYSATFGELLAYADSLIEESSPENR